VNRGLVIQINGGNLMDKIDIVRNAFNPSAPVEETKKYYADDFQWSDSQGGPVTGKDDWFRMSDILHTAMPDAGYIIDEIHQEGEDVITTGHITGTFEHDLDLTSMNMGVIKATGKPLNFPKSSSRISFKGDKIYRNKDITKGPVSGYAGFLSVFKGS
jgi:hypothetical protein